MPELKQQLTELIDAYAIARGSGSQLLAHNAASALLQFLEGIDVVIKEPAAAEPADD